MSVQILANVIADAVNRANSTIGMAERGTISGTNVITSHGAYAYDTCCPVDIYEGKEVWVQITYDGNALIIGD